MKEQKFSKEELKHSRRIYKSATPKFDLSWYIKWIASAFIVTSMSMRGIEGFQTYDLVLSIVGVSGWLCVGMLWKDRALIILNAVGLVFLFRNLLIEHII